MRVPDHSTIAEFRRRHEAEIAELFDQVLGLCWEAGLVSIGVVMIDGTKIKANASMDQNRSYSGVVREILREAEETDRREDEFYGDARGDELPEQLRTAEGRKAALQDAKRRIEKRKGRAVGPQEPERDVEVDPGLVLGRGGRRAGRREWPRVARRELESRREREAEPIPRDREDRLFQALDRLEENHRVDLAANDAYERWRSSSRDTLGRVMKGYSKPYTPPTLPDGQVNLSDPDSRVMRSKGLPHRQAYNVQTAVTEQQIILAAEISLAAADFGQLEPMLDQALAHLSRHGITEQPEAVVGDAGYWHTRQIEAIADRGIEVLVPPDGAAREGKRPGWENERYERMRDKLAGEHGRKLYALQEDHDRAGLRADQIQPARRSVHAKRQSRRALGVTVGGSDPQPPQAPQPLDRQHRLKRPAPQHTGACSAKHPPRQESRSFRIFRRPGDKAVVRNRPSRTLLSHQSSGATGWREHKSSRQVKGALRHQIRAAADCSNLFPRKQGPVYERTA